ncbi:MAG: hypothetical protein JNL40_14150 [Cyclobacteriaceae bacterium]|nr:hypothetical protein [Cyclobacteriaceae bacterium]
METQSRDDIDLQELAVRIIRYFRSHFVFILIFCAAGIGLGVAAYKALPNVYESQMVVLSDLLTKTYGDRIDESLNNLIAEGNFSELSTKLNLTADKVTSIKSVHVESQLDVKTPQRDKVDKDETYFIITVHLLDRSVLPDIQQGLLHYLRNNEFVKIRARQREQLYTAVVQRIDKELRGLDSLKQLIFLNRSFRGENLQFDPATLFTASVDLTKMRWESQQELETSNSIHLIEGFTVFEKPKDPKLTTLVAAGFLLGLLGAISLLTLKHLIKLARA